MRERASEPTQRSPASSPAPARGSSPGQPVLALQRTAGNRAVARAATAASPRGEKVIGPETEARILEDVEWIVGKLKEQVLTQNEEYAILDRIQKWDDVDHRRAVGSGKWGSVYLDRMLLALKLRTFGRRTAGGGWWEEQHSSAFDLLFHELEGARQEEWRRLLNRSKLHGDTAGGAAPENIWRTLGRQEAMGLLGAMKGLTMGAAGLVDSGATGITAAVNSTSGLFGNTKQDTLAKPFDAAGYMAEQYDFMGKQAFGSDWTDDKVLGGKSAGEIGEFGGKIIWGLVMIGAGGQLKAAGAAGGAAGLAALRAKMVIDAIGVLGNVAGVKDAAVGIASDIERLQKKDQLDKALTDPLFVEHCLSLLSNLYTGLSGAFGLKGEVMGPLTKSAASAKAAKEFADAVLPTFFELAGCAPMFMQLADIYHSDMPAEKKGAAYGEQVYKIIEKMVNVAASVAGGKDDDRAESKAQNRAAAKEAIQSAFAGQPTAAQQIDYKRAVRSAERSRRK